MGMLLRKIRFCSNQQQQEQCRDHSGRRQLEVLRRLSQYAATDLSADVFICILVLIVFYRMGVLWQWINSEWMIDDSSGNSALKTL